MVSSVVDSFDARRPTVSFINVNMQMTSRRLQLGDMHQVTETVEGECKYASVRERQSKVALTYDQRTVLA